MEEHKGLKHNHVAENVVFIWFVEVEKLLKTLISLALFAQHGLFFSRFQTSGLQQAYFLYIYLPFIYLC